MFHEIPARPAGKNANCLAGGGSLDPGHPFRRDAFPPTLPRFPPTPVYDLSCPELIKIAEYRDVS